MTSFHDLKKQVYDEIRATPFTRIHGLPTWRCKEALVKLLRNISLKYDVSYDWSGGFGLLPFIIGAARFTADNPLLPPFLQPAQPPNSPVVPANATAAQIRFATDLNNLLKRDWAVVQGFCRGVGENIRDALDLEFHAALEHNTYEFLNVLPRQYIVHLETNFCPLDAQAIADLKSNYNRGMEQNEQLLKFGTRLDQEQDNLAVDGVIITNDDKFNHYLTEIYNGGIFSTEAITQWTETPAVNQTYANARTFFETKLQSMKTVQRLTAKSGAANHGFSTAAAALELKELGDSIKEMVRETVTEAIDGHRSQGEEAAAPTDHANALSSLSDANRSQQKQIEELAKAVMALTKEIKDMRDSRSKSGGDDEANKENTPTTTAGTKRGRQPQKQRQSYEWVAGLKFDPAWPGHKKGWYRFEFKKRDPVTWKKWRHEDLDRQRAALE